MKKTLLLLVPLLAACAPTVTQPVLVDHVAMFHVGQVMKVGSHSLTDRTLPTSGSVRIASIALKSDGRYDLTAEDVETDAGQKPSDGNGDPFQLSTLTSSRLSARYDDRSGILILVHIVGYPVRLPALPADPNGTSEKDLEAITSFLSTDQKDRLCVFTDMDLGKSPYTGFAAHVSRKQLSSMSAATLVPQAVENATSMRERASNLAKAFAPDDNGPCTLELQP